MKEIMRGINDACNIIEKEKNEYLKEKLLRGVSSRVINVELSTQKGLFLQCRIDENGSRYNIKVPKVEGSDRTDFALHASIEELFGFLNSVLILSRNCVLGKFGKLYVCRCEYGVQHFVVGIVDDTIVFIIKFYYYPVDMFVTLEDNELIINAYLTCLRVDVSDYSMTWG